MKAKDYTKGSERVHWRDWIIGEVYYLENGFSPFVLVGARHDSSVELRAEYLSGIVATATKTYLIKAELRKGKTEMTKLYEIKDDKGDIQYGHKLAKNSSGKWVMEIKGIGSVVTADPKNIEEVLPYTISVNFEDGNTDFHYTSQEGVAEVGDLFVLDALHGRAIVKVTGVDTKSKLATKEFKPLGKLTIEKTH